MLFILSAAVLCADGISIGDFAVGEWIATPQYGDTDLDVFSIAVQFNERKKVHEATFWRDNVNSSEILPITDFVAGHFEIEFLSEFTGQIYSLLPSRHLMSNFEFRPVGLTMSVVTRIKLDSGESMQLTFVNGTHFSAAVSRKGTTKAVEYLVVRPSAVTEGSGQSKLKFWLYIGVLALAIQIFLWLMLRACRSNLDDKFDKIRENMVIDLDQYGKEPKIKEE